MNIKKESRNLIEQINNWLKVYLPQTRCYSSNTIQSYETAIFLFIDFLESEKHISINEFTDACFKRDVLEEWLAWLGSKRNNQKRTQDHRLNIIRSMLKYIKSKNRSMVMNYLDACEIRSISHGRGKKVEGISKEGMKVLFANIDYSTRIGKRDYTLFALMYDTGCRIGEELSIKVKDLYLEMKTPYLIVNGKGNKKRPLILAEKTIEIIKQYIGTFFGKNPNPEAYLFYSSHGGYLKQMTEDAVNNRLYIISEKANKNCPEVPIHMHCHQIRHSAASHWLQDDINIAQISCYLGHESIETTRIYIGISREELERALAKRESVIENPKKKYKNVSGGLRNYIGAK